jgi:hypothetical protein
LIGCCAWSRQACATLAQSRQARLTRGTLTAIGARYQRRGLV